MALVIIIQFAVATILVWITVTEGLERALPFYTFATVLIPGECRLEIPGLFVLTTQRLALLTLAALFLVFGNQGAASRRSLSLRWLILAHIGWCTVSTAHSIVPEYSIKKMVAEIIEYYFLYYIFSKTISDKRTIRKVVFAVVAAMSIASLAGAVEAYSSWTVLSWFPPGDIRFVDNLVNSGGRGNRIQSTFEHPILFGAAIAMAIPSAVYLISTSQSRGRKWFLWGSILLMFLSLYKTSSRGPWIAAILSFVFLLPTCGSKVRKYILVVCLLCAIVLIVRPGVWDTVQTIYESTEDPTQVMGKSYLYRYALWDVVEAALETSFGRACWGYGMESFYYLHLRGDFLGKPDHLFLSCDSAWMEMAVETGYIGLFLVGSLLLTAAFMTAKDAIRLPRSDSHLSRVFLVNLVAYYFMMLSVAMYAWGQNGDMLWITIASSLAYGRLAQAAKLEHLRPNLRSTEDLQFQPIPM